MIDNNLWKSDKDRALNFISEEWPFLSLNTQNCRVSSYRFNTGLIDIAKGKMTDCMYVLLQTYSALFVLCGSLNFSMINVSFSSRTRNSR